VKASITGSIISNSLLVLGGSLALGGWRWGKQFFNNRDASQYSAMMVMALAGVLIPFLASKTTNDTGSLKTISIGISIILLIVYALYLALHVFHLRASRRNPLQRKAVKPVSSRTGEEEEMEDDGAEEEAAAISAKKPADTVPLRRPSLWLSIAMLLGATLFTAWNSELLVGSIQPVAQQLGLSTVFIGLVIIPILGNAAEHSSALIVAYRDRIDLSMAIAAGSSIQVATLVAPLLVLISLFIGQPLDLVFQPMELALIGLATLLFTFVSMNGESTWLAGAQLIAVYIMACVVFFLLPG
jgi:Ca2+:H+ antiporter